jgi:uncharacterized LabA/DUF88 family protein
MSEIHPSQRIAVLVDAQNLYHSGMALYNQNVNYRELLSEIKGPRQLTQATAYVVRGNSPGEDSFFDALRRIGFETRIKDIREFPDGKKKADWDIGICRDAVSVADDVDTIALCSGDGDFTPLVRHLQHKGVRVEVVAFEKATSEELREAADDFLDIEKNPDRLLF